MNDLPTLISKMERLPYPIILIISFCGIFFSFFLPRLAHKYLNSFYLIKAPIFLTFLQFLTVSILSFPSLYQTIFSKKKLPTKLYIYILTSITLLLSMALDNWSIHLFLDKGSNNQSAFDNSFTIESLFKSPKILPVMVGNVVFLKKKFSFATIISVSIMVIGFVGIALGDLSSTITFNNDNFNYSGIIAVVISMILEATAANLEEFILLYCNSTQKEAISIIFSCGTIITLICSIISGEFKDTICKLIDLGNENKKQQFFAFSYLFFYSLLGAIGIHFIFLSQKVFGSLQTVSLTSLRKVFNSCISYFIINNNQFTIWYSVSFFFAISGYSMNVYSFFFSASKNYRRSRFNLSNFDNSEIVSSSGASGGTRNLNDISDSNYSIDFHPPNYTIVNNANNVKNSVDFEDIANIQTDNENQLPNKYQNLPGTSPSLIELDSNLNELGMA